MRLHNSIFDDSDDIKFKIGRLGRNGIGVIAFCFQIWEIGCQFALWEVYILVGLATLLYNQGLPYERTRHFALTVSSALDTMNRRWMLEISDNTAVTGNARAPT
ncbi:hypothetical protein V6Z98_004508 [Aspergillus fumigatus]